MDPVTEAAKWWTKKVQYMDKIHMEAMQIKEQSVKKSKFISFRM